MDDPNRIIAHGGDILVAVEVALVWTGGADSEVLLLFWRQNLQLGPNSVQMKPGNFLIQDLGEDVNTNVELASGLGELHMS